MPRGWLPQRLHITHASSEPLLERLRKFVPTTRAPEGSRPAENVNKLSWNSSPASLSTSTAVIEFQKTPSPLWITDHDN